MTQPAMAGRVAFVTGGASGIGHALGGALVARGAQVVVADINASRAAAVADLVSQVKTDHGQIDYMFNNAGIAVGGLVEEFTLDHWDRVIDVNLRGVIHGVHAVYPVMLAQGNGHIVNTASLAGLIPGPGLAPYDATKHAVVGLSLSLRAEASGRGVKVTAICPGFVDTPLLGRVNPDLPPTSAGQENGGNVSDIVGPLYQADLLAEDVMRGLAKNKALIVAPRSARVLWRMTRYAPNLALNTITKTVQRRAGRQS